jgi:hypothetical protein
MIDTSQQKLVLLHAGGGMGKTFVICKISEELFMRGEVCHCACPTGVGASHLPQGCTFHSVFKTWTPDLSASNAIDEIQTALGGNKLKIVVVPHKTDKSFWQIKRILQHFTVAVIFYCI